MKLLLSGFEPFGGDSVNPSEQLVRELATMDFGFAVRAVVLPVSFRHAFAELRKHIETFSPDVVIATGLAGDRTRITPEMVGINRIDARISDNDGLRPVGERVAECEAQELRCGLPLLAMVDACRAQGVDADISYTAGTFVCNALLFQLLYAQPSAGYRGGFIHIPPTPELAGEGRGQALEQTVAGVSAMLRALHALYL